MFKYYFKRAGNNQTIHISQRTWSILNLDRSIDVDSLTPNECLSYIETVKHSEITEAFSQCRNIKLPSDVKEIAELNFGILFSLKLPNKLTKKEFTQKSLEEKIELLSVPKSLYLYYFLSKDDLIQILRFFNKEFSKNSETIELRLLVRSILNRNQSEDDNDSDPDFIPKPFNIEQRSPVITRSKKRDTELVDPNNINNRLETFNMSKPIFFKPEFYSGEPDECVNDFIENYNLISAANEWSDDKKIMYAPIYLKKKRKGILSKLYHNNPTPSWSHFELALKEYFMSPGRARMLKAKLTNRKLKLNETVSQFLADFQLLAHKVNPNMAESEKIDLILEALPPDFYNLVALMNNNTLSDLQNNLRKVESAKATVNERNNIHNFDALKAEIEVLNKKLVEQNALVAHQLSFHNNNQNNYKRYNSNNYNNRHNDERNFEKNYLKNNKFNKNNNNYYQSNTNFPTGQHFNDIINSEQISSCTENVDEVPIPGVRLKIMGHINNIETSFILDSGATISVINSEQVINSSNSLIETKNIRVHTANGSILKVIGPALLGTDFLSKYRVQLDFFNKEIVIYKNITNKITFTFKPKRDVLSSCTIVEDSVKQNEQSKETHENKIEINIDNNSENDVNLSGQNENIILLEKLAKQINDTDKKFPPFHQIKPKINKLEINNVTLYETKKYIESDKINDTYELLNKSIISLASKFVKLENVPSDGNCGVHALVKILINEQINVNFKQITDLLKITKYKTPIWLEAEDLAAVINHYNLNLIVIQETLTSDNNSTVLAYYKSGRKCVSVFYSLNHWTPGVLSNEINTAVINSVVIYDFPSLTSRHSVLHSRYKCNDRLGGEVDTDPIEIKLSDKTPVNLRNFKLSLSEIKEIVKQTKDLLEAGIIEHSTSAYSSPIFLVPKGQPQGNIINEQGIKPTEEGLLAIRNFPSPTTIKHLRSVLGLANYFRRFIPNFSKLAHPLTELTKGKFKSKKSIIPWSETQEIAFKNLKLKLTNKPVLSHFNDNAEIILVTDGSKKGLGVILQQINENHEIHPVAYASKKLNTAQNNYSALELEMAALHFGCIHFRQYLHGRTFTVWTDHKNLIQLQTIKSESTILNRLRTKLIGFDFKIIYKKGIFNQAADFLSRYPIENNVITTNLNEHQINIVEPVNLKILQARDNYLKNIITVLENSEIADIKWKNKAKSYTLNNKNGLIYYKEKINGHPKLVLAIPEILTNENHWPLMHKQIKAYVTSCIYCQKRKPDKSKQVGKMLTYPIENGIPFSDVTIDYVGPLMPSRGFRYILVATCRVTKYCVAKACRNADAKSTTAFLLDLLLSYGAMKVVRSDNGTHFTAKVISDILTALNIKKTEGIAYRPTSQGGVEKQNQVIIDMIAPYMQNNEKWSDVLQIVLHAYNSAIHYSTGYSPFYLLHGYEPSSIFDITVIPNSLEHSVIEELNKLQKVRNTIPEILKKAFENQKMNTDKNRSDIDFKISLTTTVNPALVLTFSVCEYLI
ncbi:hypothetical protein QTP88_001932 [Uroleucon formosanum]